MLYQVNTKILFIIQGGYTSLFTRQQASPPYLGETAFVRLMDTPPVLPRSLEKTMV